MTSSLLITQCLQNDFLAPIGRYQELPNALHVGFAEARRLMGENPAEGPIARFMRWAYAQPDDALRVVHIRDWHDESDARQRTHLDQFGTHCIRDTAGAAFAFEEPAGSGKEIAVVDSLTLNDFVDTNLATVLQPFREVPARVGIVGAWTEAKVTFLAYELATRYPKMSLAVCSALAASSSTAQHHLALDQLERLLGVEVFSSVGRFIEFLGGKAEQIPLIGLRERQPRMEFRGDLRATPSDEKLLRYLFRDCRTVCFEVLDGGFSGNLVLGSESVDVHGHRQVPHVVKIGPQHAIGRERAQFERVESVLGNSAPRITEFADFDDRGAIKYRYASMGGGFSTTFQRLYVEGIPLQSVAAVLRTVFVEQLGRFYAAATLERCDLFEYYSFDPKWAPSVRAKVEALTEGPLDGAFMQIAGGPRAPNLCRFYESTLARLPRNRGDSAYFSWVHGDLNGANIIVDRQGNVWLIDFFHTKRGHVLNDLVKLENDLLYIFTKIDDDELAEALRLTDALLEVRDLGAPLGEFDLTSPKLLRAWETIRVLRSFYADLVKTDRDPLQLLVAQLRYAVHTLGFEESSELQKKWALYASARTAERLEKRLTSGGPLRVDWLDESLTAPGRVGMTLLPGRRDYYRDLGSDLAALRGAGVTHVVCLLSNDELASHGVEHLVAAYEREGLATMQLPIVDQRVCSPEEMQEVMAFVDEAVAAKGRVLVHCVGGLGRSGTVAACFLTRRGLDASSAIAEVRRARSPRAVETPLQERFVHSFARGGAGAEG